MIDREKVIKGLECCHVQRNEVPPLCEDCPYMNPMEGTCDSLDELLGDALTLLKAQEPVVMTLEEVKSSVGNDMYLEISTRTDEMPYITAATLDGAGQKGVVFYCDHFDFVAYNRRLYGWRCWTSRPSDEQMEMTPWQ